jgi:hypothetical protein
MMSELSNVLQDSNDQTDQTGQTAQAAPDVQDTQTAAQAAPTDAQAVQPQQAQPQPQAAPDNTQAPDPSQVTPPSNLSTVLSTVPSMAASDMPRFQRTVGSTLKGMLVGLVSNGIRGAIAGGVSPTGIQRAATQAQDIQQSKVQFASAQAAHMVAQAAMEDKQLQSFDEDHRLDVTKANLGIVDELNRLGLKPIATTTMNQGSAANAQSAMDNLVHITNTQGAVPPALTLHVGDQSISYDLTQLSRTPASLDQVNKVRQIQGLPQYDDRTWSAVASTPQGIAETADAWRFDAPMPTQDNLTRYSNVLANLKNQPAYQGKDADVTKVQGIVDNMSKTIDEQSTRAAQQAGKAAGAQALAAQPGTTAAQVANIKATAGPEANAAEQKAEATAKGQAAGQMAAVGGGNTSGEDFLAKLPAGRADLVRQIGDGRQELTAGMMRSKDGQLLAAQVAQAYPNFDASKSPAYFATRKDFTSGKTSVGINSYNTAIAHLGTMFDHVSDTNSLQLNNPMSDVHRQLDLDKQLVSTEMAKAVSNGQMTEGEKNQIMGSISGLTVGSYQTRIKEAAELLKGKLDAYQQQWQNGMPGSSVSPVKLVSDKAQGTLQRISGSAAPASAGAPVAGFDPTKFPKAN